MSNMDELKPDPDVLKEVWKSCIPVQFNLKLEELVQSDPPRPFFLHVPRNTYLTLVIKAVENHFKSYVIQRIDEIWFETEHGVPVKWHYPFGVLYDTYGLGQLPWTLTVNFQRFPSEQLLRCPSEDFAKWHFSQTIKEATYIKYGNINISNDLGESDSNILWNGFKTSDYNKFWGVNQKFYSVREIKNIPIRIFKPDQQKLIIQESFPVFRNEDRTELSTVLDLLRFCVPDIINQKENGDIFVTHKIIIQGTEPTLDMGLIWIACNLSCPDSFLYITLQPPKNQIL